MRINKNAIFKAIAHMFGMEANKPNKFPWDFDSETITIIKAATPYTMISRERLFSLITATRYIAKHKVEGAIVECGVWRGGAIGAAAMALKDIGEKRDLFLYDTFEGMSSPTKEDKAFNGEDANIKFQETKTGSESSDWCLASLEDVQANLKVMDLNIDDFHFVKGMVEVTIPDQSPESGIALLRLDTDWYKSTKHEMEHLFPRLVPGGVLIIDDYSDWAGSRQAVDEYIEANNIRILLNRIDGSVIGVKES